MSDEIFAACREMAESIVGEMSQQCDRFERELLQLVEELEQLRAECGREAAGGSDGGGYGDLRRQLAEARAEQSVLRAQLGAMIDLMTRIGHEVEDLCAQFDEAAADEELASEWIGNDERRSVYSSWHVLSHDVIESVRCGLARSLSMRTEANEADWMS